MTSLAPVLAATFALLTTQNVVPVKAPLPPAPQPPPMLASVDRDFAVAATQGNMAEMDAARLALSRSSTDEITAFARKMLTEHGDIASEAAPVTQPFLTTPIEPLSKPDALAMRYLASIPPVDFDQQYALLQVGDHLATLTAFQTEARDGKNPALRAFAGKWEPTIEAHLELAVSMARRIGGNSPLK